MNTTEYATKIVDIQTRFHEDYNRVKSNRDATVAHLNEAKATAPNHNLALKIQEAIDAVSRDAMEKMDYLTHECGEALADAFRAFDL